MAYLSLTTRDLNVLEKIKDPESDPSRGVLIDKSLPKDPHITDPAVYDNVAATERQIVLGMQQLELQLAGLRPIPDKNPIEAYKHCIVQLTDLIEANPTYASARNNRAQASRRLYGDNMLLADVSHSLKPLIREASREERITAAARTLADLDTAVSLLAPQTPFSALSSQAAKTLSLAFTQRAAIYHTTSKLLDHNALDIDGDRREATWTKLGFEEAASRDFAMGGRYGNDVAKGLAVSTNPTAKLCGQIVREAMKKEYGPGLAL
ncbi:Tetratricopeptide repeat protein 36-like protein [Pleurostoma richardsiae]|uniref:Tetratricopeptide repeat protein 36-like protein n=1 Tax=Pleurostoma richardsiae TaxID=41990 RepID=A0AA38VQS0_9PEZI|nr:Tetratricopeptide repeat protein 36-like protein [Pleurostoma richardsiae]